MCQEKTIGEVREAGGSGWADFSGRCRGAGQTRKANNRPPVSGRRQNPFNFFLLRWLSLTTQPKSRSQCLPCVVNTCGQTTAAS